MNTRLLRRIQKVILEEPRRIAMSRWVTETDKLPKRKRPPCGTVACIGGWAIAINGKYDSIDLLNHPDIHRAAQEALRLTDDQGPRLFSEHNWPYHFRDKIACTKPGTKRYATVVGDRITHFIDTKGAE